EYSPPVKRETLSRAARGLLGETVRSSALFRAVAGTIGGTLLVWRLRLPWTMLLVLGLLAVIYVLLSRVLYLETSLIDAELQLSHPQPVDPAEARRRARDELSRFARDIQKLNERG